MLGCRRVLPTEAGQVIASRARRILAELHGPRQEVDELRGVLRGHVWVGGLLPAGDIDVPGLLALFSRAHPGIEVSLTEGIAANMFHRLAVDELDAAFCLLAGEVSDQFALKQLSEEEAVAAFAADHGPRLTRCRRVRSLPPAVGGDGQRSASTTSRWPLRTR